METRYLRLSGRLYPDNRLMLRPAYLTESPRDSVDIKDSDVQVELYKGEMILLSWGAIIRKPLPDRIPGAPKMLEYLAFRAKVPFPPNTDCIRIRRGKAILREIPVAKNSPEFTEGVKVRKLDNGFRIDWKARHAGKLPLYYHVRTSADGGKSWIRLTTRLDKPGVFVSPDAIVGGKECLVEVVAYDGVNTVTSRTKVPEARPIYLEVGILTPYPTKKAYEPPIALRAIGRLRGRPSHLRDSIEYIWTTDNKEIARGASAVWFDPQAGEHEIVVHAKSKEYEAKSSVRIMIKSDGRK